MTKPTSPPERDGLPSLDRRSLVRGLGTAALVDVPAGTAVAYAANSETDPDAELIALGMQLEVAWAAERATFERLKGDKSSQSDTITEAAVEVSYNIVNKIEELTATTLAGAKVKAQAISWCHSGKEIGDDGFNEQCTTDVRLAASLIRDLLAIDRRPA